MGPPLCHEVEITDIRGPNAYVLVHSAAAATRVRFLLPDLLPQLKVLGSFSGVQNLKLRVSNTAG